MLLKSAGAIASLSILSSLLLNACGSYSFKTNIDPENFVEYTKPSRVDVYTNESIVEHRYHSLGMVDGIACQEKANDYIALESDARTDARIKAANLGANAIVFNKCVRLEKTNACNVSVTCYGEAFIVDDSFKKQ